MQAETQEALLGFGVAHDIGQRFPGDAIGGHLDGCRKRWKALGSLDEDLEPLMLIGGSVLAQGLEQAQFIEGRRPQVIDQAADLGEGLLCLMSHLLQ